MRRPQPYETVYRADRRKHRHRCKACRRIIQPGQPVLMARVMGRKTVAVHLECAETGHPCGTYRDAFQAWSDDYARALGHRID